MIPTPPPGDTVLFVSRCSCKSFSRCFSVICKQCNRVSSHFLFCFGICVFVFACGMFDVLRMPKNSSTTPQRWDREKPGSHQLCLLLPFLCCKGKGKGKGKGRPTHTHPHTPTYTHLHSHTHSSLGARGNKPQGGFLPG